MKALQMFFLGTLMSIIFISCDKNETLKSTDTEDEISGTAIPKFAEIKMCKDVYPDGVTPRAAAIKSKIWSNGSTISVRLYGGSNYVRQKVRDYADQWSNYANIKFNFVTSGNADIRITFTDGAGSYSYIGTDAKRIPKNQETMNFGWFDDNTSDEEFSRTTIHEFGHALGLIHEHQHPEASIPWNKPLVYEYYAGAPNYWSKEDVDNNLFATYSTSQTQYSNYDKQSIMHYAVSKDLTDGIFEVGWNTVLSSTDKSFISSLYPTN